MTAGRDPAVKRTGQQPAVTGAVQAVLFDLDDTLCEDLAHAEHTLRTVAKRAQAHLPALTTDRLVDVYNQLSLELWDSIDLVRPPRLTPVRRQMWERALAECGHASCDPAIVDDLVALHIGLRHSGVRLFPDALATLDTLRGRGLRLGLVTNGVSETHAEKIVALGIRDHFDVVFMPDEIGFAKPDVRIFHLACKRLDVPPAEAVMVGDNPMADIAGAKGAGLRAVWFNPSGRPFPSTTLVPDAQVRALAELTDVFADWSAAATASP